MSRTKPLLSSKAKIIVVAVVLALVAVGIVARMSVQGDSVERGLAKSVEKTKQDIKLPHKVDDVTQLVGVRSKGRTAVFSYKLSKDADLESVDRGKQKRSLAKEVCADKQLKQHLSRGAQARYVYEGSGGEPTLTITIKIKDCQPSPS